MYITIVEIEKDKKNNKSITYSVIDTFENDNSEEELAYDYTNFIEVKEVLENRTKLENESLGDSSPFTNQKWYRARFRKLDTHSFKVIAETMMKAGRFYEAKDINTALLKAIDINKKDEKKEAFVFECGK